MTEQAVAELPHILVIDDDTRLRDLLQRYLSDQGFRVTTAVDAADARAKLTALAFDLLVLDIMMPGRDGFEVCQTLRADPAMANTKIVMLTARSRDAEQAKGLALGADDYITKPFSTRDLVARVQELLAA